MSDRDEFERVFKGVFKGHRMTRGSNGDYIGIVPWSAWKIWQAQRPAPVVLHEDMTEDFKEQWQNGLPLDSAEARWAFCGWKAARAQQAGSGEAVAYRVTECPGLTYLVDTIEDAEHGKAFYGYGYEALYTHPGASRPNLSTIAQKKLDQMGATVHGVLVKNEAGAWAAVSDSGRVMWLDGFEGKSSAATPQPADSVPEDRKTPCQGKNCGTLDDAKHSPECIWEHEVSSGQRPKPQPEVETCEWHSDDNGAWMSACGKEWYFEDSGPEDNGMNYCVKCGKPCIDIGNSEDGGEDHDNAMQPTG